MSWGPSGGKRPHRSTRLQDSTAPGNGKSGPAEDLVVGDDMESRNHSKRIPSGQGVPLSQAPTAILFFPGLWISPIRRAPVPQATRRPPPDRLPGPSREVHHG